MYYDTVDVVFWVLFFFIALNFFYFWFLKTWLCHVFKIEERVKTLHNIENLLEKIEERNGLEGKTKSDTVQKAYDLDKMIDKIQ